MSRILVAISSPWAANRVAEPVVDLARKLGAEVLIVHVSRPSGGQMREQEQGGGRNGDQFSAPAASGKIDRRAKLIVVFG